jgi:hypothetical protein
MARIRSIKPEFWQDEKLAPLSDACRLVFIALWSMADDFGRLVDNEKAIEAFVWPHEDRSTDTRESLATLARLGRIVRGRTASGQSVIQVTNWGRHQKVDKPSTRSALPEIVAAQTIDSARESRGEASRALGESLAESSRSDLGSRTLDLGPPTKNARGRAGGGQADPRIRLVVAANRAIAERLGVDEQPVGINANTGHAFEAADAILKEHGIPVEFAEYAIGEVARTANWDKPPRSLKYFVDAVVRRWQAGDHGAVFEVRESSAAGGSDLRERAEWLRREVFSTGIHTWYQHQFEDLFAQSREQMADPERLRREWALYGREIKRILDRHPKEGEFLPALIKVLAQHSSGEAREVAAR